MALPENIQKHIQNIEQLSEQITENLLTSIEEQVKQVRDTLQKTQVQLFSELKGYSTRVLDSTQVIDKELEQQVKVFIFDYQKAVFGLANKIFRTLIQSLTFTGETFLDRIDKAIKSAQADTTKFAELFAMKYTQKLLDTADTVFDTVFGDYFRQRITRGLQGLLAGAFAGLPEQAQIPESAFTTTTIQTLFSPYVLRQIDKAFVKVYGELIREIRSITEVYNIKAIKERARTVFDILMDIGLRTLRQVTTIASVIPLLRDYLFCQLKQCKEEFKSPLESKLTEIKEILNQFYQKYVQDSRAREEALRQLYGQPTGLLGRIVGGLGAARRLFRRFRAYLAGYPTEFVTLKEQIEALERLYQDYQELQSVLTDYLTGKGYKKFKATLSLFRKRISILLDQLSGKLVPEYFDQFYQFIEQGTADTVYSLIRRLKETNYTDILSLQLFSRLFTFGTQELPIPFQTLMAEYYKTFATTFDETLEQFMISGEVEKLAKVIADKQKRKTEKQKQDFLDTIVSIIRTHMKGLEIYEPTINVIEKTIEQNIQAIKEFADRIQQEVFQGLRPEDITHFTDLNEELINRLQQYHFSPDQLEEIALTLRSIVQNSESIIGLLSRVQQTLGKITDIQKRFDTIMSETVNAITYLDTLLQTEIQTTEDIAKAAQQNLEDILANIKEEQIREHIRELARGFADAKTVTQEFTSNFSTLVDTITNLEKQYQEAVSKGFVTEAANIQAALEGLRAVLAKRASEVFSIDIHTLRNLVIRITAQYEQQRERLIRMYAAAIEKGEIELANMLETRIEELDRAYQHIIGLYEFRTNITVNILEKILRTSIFVFLKAYESFIDTTGKIISGTFTRAGQWFEGFIRILEASQVKLVRDFGTWLRKNTLNRITTFLDRVVDWYKTGAELFFDKFDKTIREVTTYIFRDVVLRKLANIPYLGQWLGEKYLALYEQILRPLASTFYDTLMGSLALVGRTIESVFLRTRIQESIAGRIIERIGARIKGSKLVSDIFEKAKAEISGAAAIFEKAGTLGKKAAQLLRQTEQERRLTTLPEFISGIYDHTKQIIDILTQLKQGFSNFVQELFDKRFGWIELSTRYLESIYAYLISGPIPVQSVQTEGQTTTTFDQLADVTKDLAETVRHFRAITRPQISGEIERLRIGVTTNLEKLVREVEDQTKYLLAVHGIEVDGLKPTYADVREQTYLKNLVTLPSIQNCICRAGTQTKTETQTSKKPPTTGPEAGFIRPEALFNLLSFGLFGIAKRLWNIGGKIFGGLARGAWKIITKIPFIGPLAEKLGIQFIGSRLLLRLLPVAIGGPLGTALTIGLTLFGDKIWDMAKAFFGWTGEKLGAAKDWLIEKVTGAGKAVLNVAKAGFDWFTGTMKAIGSKVLSFFGFGKKEETEQRKVQKQEKQQAVLETTEVQKQTGKIEQSVSVYLRTLVEYSKASYIELVQIKTAIDRQSELIAKLAIILAKQLTDKQKERILIELEQEAGTIARTSNINTSQQYSSITLGGQTTETYPKAQKALQ